MARRRDILCAGTCGQLIWGGKGVLPPGLAMCHACRRARRVSSVRVTIGPIECPGCSQMFRPRESASGYRRRVCSEECRATVRRRGRDAVHPPARRWVQQRCVVCCGEYRRTYADQRTCGRGCGALIHSRLMLKIPLLPVATVGLCAECGGIATGKTCGPACERQRLRRQQLAYIGQTPEAVDAKCCGRCGESLLAWGGGSRRRFCGPCAQIRKRESMRDTRRRRRARERRALTEPYTLAEIAKRDKFRCGICHGRVAMTKTVPHLKAPTIDHLIPISEGGDDVKANVQLAHFWCNSIRGVGGTVQLALVG